MKKLFVTGAYRSGTTFLEKILHNHPEISVASQPFPQLFIQVKKNFLEGRGLKRRYPLGHGFLEREYTEDDFKAFLSSYMISRDLLNSVFDAMETYTGLWTPEMLNYRGQVEPGTFWQVYTQLNRYISEVFPKPGLVFVGSKEIFCEEYVSFLLSREVKVIVTIRDPRDVVASVNFRDKDNQTGENRPILFTARVWRKSVATVLKHQGHPNFHWIRYEDLSLKPSEVLYGLAKFLGLSTWNIDSHKDLLDQQGNIWTGNSSFREQSGISDASVAGYKSRLPYAVKVYIETVCLPEMRTIGYVPDLVSNFDPAVLAEFKTPFEKIHAEFPVDYDSRADHVREETDRYKQFKEANIE